jgi:hypothetical protein
VPLGRGSSGTGRKGGVGSVMKPPRFFFSAVVLVLLGTGYLSSQYFALTGTAAQWGRMIDQPPVVWLSLGILVAAVALALLPEREEQP